MVIDFFFLLAEVEHAKIKMTISRKLMILLIQGLTLINVVLSLKFKV